MTKDMVYLKIINKSKHNHGASLNIIGKAIELRRMMTPQEKLLWGIIRKRQLNGFYFRRQHPYGIYILDFYCFEANLVIEVDGGIHEKQKENDEERTRYLESSGLTVIRFKNEDIEKRPDWVIKQISRHLEH